MEWNGKEKRRKRRRKKQERWVRQGGGWGRLKEESVRPRKTMPVARLIRVRARKKGEQSSFRMILDIFEFTTTEGGGARFCLEPNLPYFIPLF